MNAAVKLLSGKDGDEVEFAGETFPLSRRLSSLVFLVKILVRIYLKNVWCRFTNTNNEEYCITSICTRNCGESNLQAMSNAQRDKET